MFGDRIRELRAAKGISQVELAERLSVSKQTISNWENGNILPSIEMLVKLADYFGMTTDYLLERTDRQILETDGLPLEFLQHLNCLIQDYRSVFTAK